MRTCTREREREIAKSFRASLRRPSKEFVHESLIFSCMMSLWINRSSSSKNLQESSSISNSPQRKRQQQQQQQQRQQQKNGATLPTWQCRIPGSPRVHHATGRRSMALRLCKSNHVDLQQFQPSIGSRNLIKSPIDRRHPISLFHLPYIAIKFIQHLNSDGFIVRPLIYPIKLKFKKTGKYWRYIPITCRQKLNCALLMATSINRFCSNEPYSAKLLDRLDWNDIKMWPIIGLMKLK